MAGPNMEVFRFGFYLLFPLGFMIYFGDPAWYDKHVRPIRDRFTPPETEFRHPRTTEELRESLHKPSAPAKSIINEVPVAARMANWRATDKERLI
ncbi:uncharacterized protein MJAP1_002972 [Malassezia japonica]|uniref:Uncharacterized protein n=1 Tax=Malassezia japonica TaxID=223818 RepID=A0AAF0JB84_9BASI|nr:uncharacterized protein MJAP1_002972 [Malassezia japonica]WFD39990.1 hypothetical protein MJAP1_002972 [Malassezia japonica]